MSPVAATRDVGDEPEPVGGFPGGQPQVFVRIFSVPAGMPWEQVRAAKLEARHGAPLPIAELMHQLRRLSAWAPGRAARYGVFYIRAREFKQPFETVVEVDGEPIRVAFGAGAEQLKRARYISLVGLIAALSTAILAGAVTLALNARTEAAGRLARVEQIAAARLHAASVAQRQAQQARALRAVIGRAKPVANVLSDLAWASASKAPEVRVVALHWDHGLMAAEARGEAPPFPSSGRQVVRAATPIRPGVWLWGIQPENSSKSSSTPNQRGER